MVALNVSLRHWLWFALNLFMSHWSSGSARRRHESCETGVLNILKGESLESGEILLRTMSHCSDVALNDCSDALL